MKQTHFYPECLQQIQCKGKYESSHCTRKQILISLYLTLQKENRNIFAAKPELFPDEGLKIKLVLPFISPQPSHTVLKIFSIRMNSVTTPSILFGLITMLLNNSMTSKRSNYFPLKDSRYHLTHNLFFIKFPSVPQGLLLHRKGRDCVMCRA